MSKGCMMCGIDTLECSEGVRHAVYYLIGKNRPADDGTEICERHLEIQVMGLAMLATFTGFGEYAESIRKVLEAPKLRLVPPPNESEGDG